MSASPQSCSTPGSRRPWVSSAAGWPTGGRPAPRPHEHMTGRGRLLVVDVGTSGLRAAIVDRDARVRHVHQRELLPSSPAPGFVEFDPVAMARAAREVATAALAAGGPVEAVGI